MFGHNVPFAKSEGGNDAILKQIARRVLKMQSKRTNLTGNFLVHVQEDTVIYFH